MNRVYEPSQSLNHSNSGVKTDSGISQAVNLKIERLESGQRHVLAKIRIPHSLDQVWQVLTSYEAFAEFTPNLVQVQRLTHPLGGIRLEQVRVKSFMGVRFKARAVLDVEEKYPHQIHYKLIEGSFKSLSGFWQLSPISSSDGVGVDLFYDFLIWPKRRYPASLVENILKDDVPVSLLAIRQRVDELSKSLPH
jgi:ribosome-associated toxin RatA of RatAB toxin-antitoxin module